MHLTDGEQRLKLRHAITRPAREPKTFIGAAVPLADAKRLHQLAASRSVSLSTLLRTALEQTYGTAKQPKHT